MFVSSKKAAGIARMLDYTVFMAVPSINDFIYYTLTPSRVIYCKATAQTLITPDTDTTFCKIVFFI